MSKPTPILDHRCERSRHLPVLYGQAGLVFVFILFSFLAACTPPRQSEPSADNEIRAVLDQQVREWNAGNLAGFMDTYAKSDITRFAARGDIALGWETIFERYRNSYSNRAAMGTLTFSDLEVEPLGSDAALAFGRWHLKREHDEPSGLFTLIFRKTQGNDWRIVHDHTSAAERN